MEYFLREYTARSILPHINVVAKGAATDPDHGIRNHRPTNTTTSNFTSSGDSGDSSDNINNLFFIELQQQLLLDSFASDDVAVNGVSAEYLDTRDNETSAFHLLETLASVTTTTISTITNGTNKSLHEFSSHLLHDSNSSDAGSFAFSCDGDSLNGTDDGSGSESDSALSSVYFKTAVYLLYIPIFVFALLGNGTVCYIVQSTPRMRTVTNFFIANLAVGDILMSLFCVPSSFISIFILGYWPFGMALCHLVNYSQAVSVLVSAYTLVAISIDRYIAIMWPLRPRITKRYAKFIIVGIWAIALATALPIPIVSKLVQPAAWHEYCDRYVCQEEWPTAEQYYYYTLALLTLQFIVPLSVLIFTYTRIAIAVWGKRPPGEAENSRDQRMARSKRKVSLSRYYRIFEIRFCFQSFSVPNQDID